MTRSQDLGIVYLMSNIGITAAVFYLPLLLRARAMSDLQIGYLAVPYSIALFLSNSVFGKLADSHGRKPFLFAGLISSAVTTSAYVLPHSFMLYAILRLLNGISLGMFPAAIIALASDHKTPMGQLSSWRAAGWAFGAIFNGFLSELIQLEAAFLVGGSFYLFAFCTSLLRDIGGSGDRQKQVELQQDRPVPNYRQVIRANWQVYLVVILRHGSGASIWIYWTLFLQQDLGLNNFQIGVVLAINTIVQTIVMRSASDRGNPQRMLLWGTFLSALAFISFTISQNFVQICLTQILLGISFSFFLVGGLRTAEYRGNQLGMVGTATGLFEASFSISQLVGPLLALVVFSHFGTYVSLMYVATAITLVGTLLYGFISFNKSLEVN